MFFALYGYYYTPYLKKYEEKKKRRIEKREAKMNN